MPRVHHVKSARKAIPDSGIKVGDSYYWWKFRYGGKRVSKTPPRRSQLTQSDYYGQLYDLEDEIAALVADDSLPSAVEDIASRLRDLGEEQGSKRDNMPEALHDSDTGQLLEQRQSDCESAADEFEGIDMDGWEADEDATTEARKDDPDHEEVNADGETEEEYWQARLDEVQAVSIEIN